jgi:hypothetical protein
VAKVSGRLAPFPAQNSAIGRDVAACVILAP